MDVEELEKRIAEIRARPLLVVCRTAGGAERSMTIRECIAAGGVFLHVAADDLDALLGKALGGDHNPVSFCK